MICYHSSETKRYLKTHVTFKQAKRIEMRLIKLYPGHLKQRILGFGGAFTEAAAYTLAKMSAGNRQAVLDAYFGETGNRYTLCRTHIQSCDFSLHPSSYLKDAGDTELSGFSLAQDEKYLIPLIKDALKLNPAMTMVASPWSPPAFMKSNRTMRLGGRLRKEYYGMWADMLVKYVQEYQKQGIKVAYLTIQNEAAALQLWESCKFGAAEERDFAVNYLRKRLDAAGWADVKLLVWDHNKDKVLERAMGAISDSAADAAIDGVAFHWYAGDHFEALQEVRSLFPEKELLFTEGCVEHSRLKSAGEVQKAEMYAHDIMGNLKAGATGIIDWNLALDSRGGPNHTRNFCDAPILCDTKNDKVNVKLMYDYIGHFSRFIMPGARQALVSRFTDAVNAAGFVNPDGGKVVVVLNKTDESQRFHITEGERLAKIEMEPHSIMTAVWE